MSKLVNLFGGPGIGKSSIAAGITYKLKKRPYKYDQKPKVKIVIIDFNILGSNLNGPILSHFI